MNDLNKDALLHRIYAASIDESEWPLVLDAFMELLGSPSGHLSFISLVEPEKSIVYEGNIAPGFGSIYQERMVDDPWFKGAIGLRTGDFFLDHELCLASDYKKTDYYHEVSSPYAVEHSVGGVILRDDQHNVVITGNAPGDFKGFNQDSKRLVEELLPHLRRAFQTSLKFSGLNRVVGNLTQSLDIFDVPVALLDQHRLVCYCNASFEQALREVIDLSMIGRRLVTRFHEEQKALDGLIERCLESITSPGMVNESGIRIRGTEGKSAFNLVITPLRSANDLAGSHSNARLMITLSDFDVPRELPSVDLIMALYGLTNKQARLARCLLSGMSLKVAADVLGVKEQTARSYLKEIFTRTDSNSQTELLLRLSSLSR